jgi:hypothetical protein
MWAFTLDPRRWWIARAFRPEPAASQRQRRPVIKAPVIMLAGPPGLSLVKQELLVCPLWAVTSCCRMEPGQLTCGQAIAMGLSGR